MFAVVRRERLALCDQLDGLSDEQWNEASLCPGWRVRDVLGHLVSLQAVPMRRFILGKPGMAAFDERAERFGREYGARRPSELIALYRKHAGARRAPPLMGPIAPLTDIAVHSLDIQRPLGLPPTTGDDTRRTVLDACCGGLIGFVPKRLVAGLRFEASDLDWSRGDGPTVRASTGDLLLATNGRPVDAAAFEGDGAADFVGRLAS